MNNVVSTAYNLCLGNLLHKYICINPIKQYFKVFFIEGVLKASKLTLGW